MDYNQKKLAITVKGLLTYTLKYATESASIQHSSINALNTYELKINSTSKYYVSHTQKSNNNLHHPWKARTNIREKVAANKSVRVLCKGRNTINMCLLRVTTNKLLLFGFLTNLWKAPIFLLLSLIIFASLLYCDPAFHAYHHMHLLAIAKTLIHIWIHISSHLFVSLLLQFWPQKKK